VTVTWVTDSEPNERFTLYTRGNVGEVFPHVITPLTGTLIGDAIRQAQSDVLVEMGVLHRGEVAGPSATTGVFGGYLYMNGSAMRLFGVRMPGMTWRDADGQVMGAVEGAPPYEPAKGDRNLTASLATVRYSTKLLRRPDLEFLATARTDAQRWLATMPDLTEAPDQYLLRWLDDFPARQAASMKRLLQAAMFAGAPRGILDQLLEQRQAPPGLANRIVSGTGDVDSAQLAQRMWLLGRIVAADERLGAAFGEGLDRIAERTAATDLQPAIDAFLADHGHRGNDEYELATPAWVMDPAPVYAAIDRLRNAPEDRDPVATTRRLAADADRALADALQLVRRPMRWLLRRSAMVARQGAIARERAKDIMVLENLGARQVLHELVRRAAERGGPSDPRLGFCVTIDELADYLARPAAFSDVIAERAARAEYLNQRVPPPWFDGRIPDPSTWSIREEVTTERPAAGTVISGIAVAAVARRLPARTRRRGSSADAFRAAGFRSVRHSSITARPAG
jgi:pyruvate,water dikinase